MGKGKGVYTISAICRQCHKNFQPTHGTQRYCSSNCRKTHVKSRKVSFSAYPGLATATVGTIGELRVAIDLLAQGYEVFRAVSTSCSCDLAVLKNKKLLRLEVRTGYRVSNGKIYSAKDPKDLGRQDHYAFVLPSEIVYDPPLPET